MTISTLPPAPSRADAANADTYSEIADTFVAALPVFSTQVNDTLTTVNAAAMSAIASANFKGAWSSLSGAMNVPASVLHSDTLWLLVTNTTDITADVPGVSAKWINLSTYSGYVALTGDQTIAGNKTFTGILQTTSPSQATVGAVKTGSGASNAFLFNNDSAYGVYDDLSGYLVSKQKSGGLVNIAGNTVIAGSITADSISTSGTITGNGSGITAIPPSAVQTATSSLGVGEIGTYALLKEDNTTSRGPGDILAGSSLTYAHASGGQNGSPASGTWRCMGFKLGGASADDRVTVWLRIS